MSPWIGRNDVAWHDIRNCLEADAFSEDDLENDLVSEMANHAEPKYSPERALAAKPGPFFMPQNALCGIEPVTFPSYEQAGCFNFGQSAFRTGWQKESAGPEGGKSSQRTQRHKCFVSAFPMAMHLVT